MINQKNRRLLQNVGVIILIIFGLWWVISQFIKFNINTFTDNAQIKQHIVPVNSRIPGFIKEIRFDEYTKVSKGDTLVIIEDSEFRLRVAQAHADLQNAMSGKSAMSTAISTTQNNLTVSDAAIKEVEALLNNAQKDYERYQQLLNDEAVTRQQFETIETKYLSLKAKYEMLSRQRQSTSLIGQEQSHRLGQNEAGIELAKAAIDLAELNLSYTIITAPCDGYTSRKSIQEGQLVQPGQTLLSIVDSNDVWVIANYKETQTSKMAIGQRVNIEVDAIPGVTFKGIIESISQATGAQYSIIPQDNATGNFVKVEQRIPIKISFSEDNKPEDMARLRAGLNVECEVIED